MRAVIQRTLLPASVTVENEEVGAIGKGLIVYLGVGNEDTKEDISWLINKIIKLRIFSDEEGKMNLSIADISGGLLVISQFTLYASTKKGNRPSYIKSAKPEFAKIMYDCFLTELRASYSGTVGTGIFGADMKVSYVNDGPVTIIMDSKNKE